MDEKCIKDNRKNILIIFYFIPNLGKILFVSFSIHLTLQLQQQDIFSLETWCTQLLIMVDGVINKLGAM